MTINLGTWWRQHRKLVVFIGGGLLTFLTQYYGSTSPWVQFATLILTGISVWGVPNEPMPTTTAEVAHGKHEGPTA